jgi:2-iminobutanoate/2-iminopropanoate deaminase
MYGCGVMGARMWRMEQQRSEGVKRTSINAVDAPQSSGGYSQAVLVKDAKRTLYISGQIPMDRAGKVPEAFTEQARLTWANVMAQLEAAEMDTSNIVKVTTYLSDRQYADENGAERRSVLGDHAPALTVIICGIYDQAWLLEIEVVAMS